ncbi:hypothetical protein ACNF49_03115 [Actinomadura sp. ATCC 39365]
MQALKGVEPAEFTPVDHSRFGGCSDKCAPKPKKKKRGGDEGPGDGDPFENFFGDHNDRGDGGGDGRGPGDWQRPGNGFGGGLGDGLGDGLGGQANTGLTAPAARTRR